MHAALLHAEEFELDESDASRSQPARGGREVSSKTKWTTQARYRRRANASAGAFSGSHRRRQKRNYL